MSPGTSKTPPSSRMLVSSVTESPLVGCSGLSKSPCQSSGGGLVVETPTKQSPIWSPLKSILKTPVKASSGLHLLNSPLLRTSKKSVTWSPSPPRCKLVEDDATFKVPKSPSTTSFSSPRQVQTPSKLKRPFQTTNTKRDIFKTPDKFCQVNLLRLSEQDVSTLEEFQTSSEKCSRKETPEERDAPLLSTPPSDQQSPPQHNSTPQEKTPSPTHRMITRSGRTPGRSSETASPGDPTVTQLSEGSHLLVKSPAKVLTKRSGSGCRASRQINLEPGESFVPEKSPASAEKTVHSFMKEEQAESSQPSETSSSLCTESQESDSSCGHSATTDDSLDIVDAAVVMTQFNKGLKMNISYSRKPSVSDDRQSPSRPLPSQSTPSRSYGFRQTPDRQQREAAARLGYANDFPRLSYPRGPARSNQQRSAKPPTYKVELEMQTSGLPKLRFKCTDSVNAEDFVSDGGLHSGPQSPSVRGIPHMESPVALLTKQRDPACCSPSLCAHVTPAKSTPGKGGGVQTYICQSYTPTHHPAAAWSPAAVADTIPLTPSPQSVGKVTPENLNSWPRRKRAHFVVHGDKDRVLKGEPQLEELLEEAELGVCRLQDFEDTDEPLGNPKTKKAPTSKQVPAAAAAVSPLSPLEDLFWMEKLVKQDSCAESQKAEEVVESSKQHIWQHSSTSFKFLTVNSLGL